MNYIIIFLGVVLIMVIFYYIYKSYLSDATKLDKLTNLNYSVPVLQVKDKPQNVNVSYGIWLYVNTWSTTNIKYIFYRTGDVYLYLDKSTATLYCDVAINQPTGSSSDYVSTTTVVGAPTGVQHITVTNNFPMQKWVYIIVSNDGKGFTDIYLDGKLVKSIRLAASRPTLPDNDVGIYVGNSSTGLAYYDAYITKFQRYTYTMDPQTAWNTYVQGNGMSGLSNMFSNYGVAVSLYKDNVETASLSFNR